MGAFLSTIGGPLAAIVLFRPLVWHFAGYLAQLVVNHIEPHPFAFSFNHGGDCHGGQWMRVEYGPLWLMRPAAIPEPQPPPPPRPVSTQNHQHQRVHASVAACGLGVKAPPPERPLGVQACQPPSDSMGVTNHLEKIWL